MDNTTDNEPDPILMPPSPPSRGRVVRIIGGEGGSIEGSFGEVVVSSSSSSSSSAVAPSVVPGNSARRKNETKKHRPLQLGGSHSWDESGGGNNTAPTTTSASAGGGMSSSSNSSWDHHSWDHTLSTTGSLEDCSSDRLNNHSTNTNGTEEKKEEKSGAANSSNQSYFSYRASLARRASSVGSPQPHRPTIPTGGRRGEEDDDAAVASSSSSPPNSNHQQQSIYLDDDRAHIEHEQQQRRNKVAQVLLIGNSDSDSSDDDDDDDDDEARSIGVKSPLTIEDEEEHARVRRRLQAHLERNQSGGGGRGFRTISQEQDERPEDEEEEAATTAATNKALLHQQLHQLQLQQHQSGNVTTCTPPSDTDWQDAATATTPSTGPKPAPPQALQQHASSSSPPTLTFTDYAYPEDHEQHRPTFGDGGIDGSISPLRRPSPIKPVITPVDGGNGSGMFYQLDIAENSDNGGSLAMYGVHTSFVSSLGGDDPNDVNDRDQQDGEIPVYRTPPRANKTTVRFADGGCADDPNEGDGPGGRTAEQKEEDEIKRKMQRKQQRRCVGSILVIGAALLVLAVVLVLVFVLGGKGGDGSGSDSSNSAATTGSGSGGGGSGEGTIDPDIVAVLPSYVPAPGPTGEGSLTVSPITTTTQQPTPSPTLLRKPAPVAVTDPPTPAPSEATAGTRIKLRLFNLLVPLSGNRTDLVEPGTAQNAAFSWLADSMLSQEESVGTTTNIDSNWRVDWWNEDARIVQRYALATLYFGTNGRVWSTAAATGTVAAADTNTNNDDQVSALWLSDADACDWELPENDSEDTGNNNNDYNNKNTACYWNGLLKRLYLSGAGLDGQLPPELGLLTTLEELDLSANNLQGPLVPQLSQLGSSLKYLNLRSNRLTGTFPDAWTALNRTDLVMRLDGNDMTGSVPEAACRAFEQSWATLYLDCAGPNPDMTCGAPGSVGCCSYCCSERDPTNVFDGASEKEDKRGKDKNSEHCECAYAGTPLEYERC